jgi:sugar lactone lactonase YvrE
VPDVKLLLDARATIAESLLWEPGAGVLFWVDISGPALFRLDPASLESRRWELPAEVGAFALLDDRSVLVALRTGLHVLSRATGALELLAPPPFDPQRFRFNEGACDAAGRFWVGQMFDPLPGVKAEPEPGPLGVWTEATGLVPQPDTARCHNGMGWSPDGRTFYLSHSQEQTIFAFPFEAETGRLGGRRVFARIDKGIPDGAAVDEEGAYWCAIHGGGALHRYAPDGTLLQSVPLPVSQPTMCAFGGPDLRTLFISSASDHLDAEQHRREPLAGGLFRLTPGVRGLPRPCYAR